MIKKWVSMGGKKIKNNKFVLKALIRDILPYGLTTYLLKKREQR